MSRLKRVAVIAVTMALCLFGSLLPASATGYNWRKATMWALLHAQDNQPGFNGCAWFVSNALWAGGLTQNDQWHNKGVRIGTPPLPGTKTATVAEDLYNHLKQRGMRVLQITDRYNPKSTSVPEARPGDVIAYDWDSNGHVDHISMVVNIAPGSYPEVSEWGSAPNGKVSPYERRGWSWSASHAKWQKQVQPRVRAYLVLIR